MKKILRSILLIFIVITVAFSFTIIYQGYDMYKDATNEVSVIEKVDEVRNSDDYVLINDVSKDFTNAIISVEDHRFFKHNGIDTVAIGRAMVNNIKAKAFVEGGSTITQQLAKNLFFSREKEIRRKIAELFVVNQLEKNYSKEEILELYINVIYYGDGYTGIKQATKGYFNLNTNEITFYQAVILAGLPQAPSIYALSKNYEGAITRSKEVVWTMVENEYLTFNEANKLFKDKILVAKSL